MNRTYVRGKQKFQCPYCTSKFSQKHNLKMHVKQKHDENFETTDFRNISRISNDSEILAKNQKIKDNLEVSEHQNHEENFDDWKLASNLESSTGVRSCESLPLEDEIQF